MRRFSRPAAFTARREAERASEDLFILTCIINKPPTPPTLSVPLAPRSSGRRGVGGAATGGSLLVLFGSPSVRGMEGRLRSV